MSKETAGLLEALESFPEDEKRAFTVEFPRRTVPFDSGPLDHAGTAHAADRLLAPLGVEEDEARAR
jgi:hypothetical protein